MSSEIGSPVRGDGVAKLATPQNSSGSDMPEWMKTHESPFKDGNLLVIQSDSEDSIGARRSGKTGQLADAKQEAETVTKEEEAAAVPARRKGGIKEQGGSDQCAIKASGSQEPPKTSAGSSAVDGIPGELPLVLPEKIPQNRMIVELQDVPQRSMDLSGDSGAIGRLLVTGKKGQEQMQVDLKGVVFSACIVPAPATLAVLHLTSSEAKVESLSSCYVQLRESCEAGQQQGDADDGERYAHLFAPSQHEPDYSQPLPQGSGPDAEKKHRPKAEGAGKKAAKRPRPASKPTSKPGLKPAGVAKKSGSKKSASKPSKGRKPAS